VWLHELILTNIKLIHVLLLFLSLLIYMSRFLYDYFRQHLNHLSVIQSLNGSNYASWRETIEIALAPMEINLVLMEIDLVLTTDTPKELEKLVIHDGEIAQAFATRERDFTPIMMAYDLERAKWDASNHKCLMVIKSSIKKAIRGGILDCETAKEYLKKVEIQFTGSSKTYASTIIKRLVTEKYSFGNGVREHILKMSNMASKLKIMDMGLKNEFLVHLVMSSLPKKFEAFEINYNSQPENWGIEKLIDMCVQKEERIKDARGDSINHVKHNKKNFSNSSQSKKNYSHDHKASSSKGQGKAPMNEHDHMPKGVCRHCKQEGHYVKDCIEFLKWLNMRGKNKCKDLITSTDEFLYLDYSIFTLWIDSGATIYVVNSLQELHMRRILPRGERIIRVANGEEAEIEAIGGLSLEISNDFTFHLHDVLFVPSMRRNLISVSCLDDDGFRCLFGKKQCLITFNDEVVGRAFRHDKLYLLSIKDSINVISSENIANVSSSNNKRKKIDDVSLKLWHRRLVHILRGRIERLVKESILPPLEFLYFEQCIDCIKGKYIKQIKKYAKKCRDIRNNSYGYLRSIFHSIHRCL
jgi:hypothetical protein